MTSNTSFYAVPVAWFIALAPRGYAVSTFSKHSKAKANMKNPRSFTGQVNQDPTLTPLIRDRIVRAESAQLNGLENLGYFAASVAIANVAGVDASLVNWLAWSYVASRCAYNWIYIMVNDTQRTVPIRTAVYFVGIAINTAFWVVAGRNWQKV